MRSFLLLAAVALSLAACDTAAPDLSAPPPALAEGHGGDTALGPALGPALAAVRAATAKYHRVDRAVADGWGAPPAPEAEAPISPCVDDSFPVDLEQDLGAMGHHYINVRLMDGELDPSTPEILLYEPTKNGRFRLIGVEYVVPVEQDEEGDWVSPGPAPELFGQTFELSRGAGGWALHVWVWKNNPSGMFADFNPSVSCEYAQAPGA